MKNKNPTLLILVGAPGSGKSSFARYFLRTEINWARISRDDFRAMLFEGTKASDNTEMMISTAIDASIKAYLLKGINVIIDATHCKKDYIKQYITKYNTLANIEFKVFDVPLQELIKRCEKREALTGNHIPLQVVEKFAKQFEHLKGNFDFSPIPIITETFTTLPFKENLPDCFLCDLDGTIAKANGRTMFNPTSEEIMADTPILPVIKVLQSLTSQYKVIFVSGREDSTFEATKKWIQNYVVSSIEDSQLLMRKTGDFRRDSIIKKEFLHNLILPKYNVIGVFDDRLQVVRECWNEEGIFCFNVNQLLEEF